MTPPVSPLCNLHSGQPSNSVSWYYSDAPLEAMDFNEFEAITSPRAVQPSHEAIDDLVSEHFRNCGVNPDTTGSAEYDDVFRDQEHYAFDHVTNRHSVMHQVIFRI